MIFANKDSDCRGKVKLFEIDIYELPGLSFNDICCLAIDCKPDSCMLLCCNRV